MAFPDGVLDDGERVVLHGRPHWWIGVRPALLLLLVAAPAGFAAAVVRLQVWAPIAWATIAVVGTVAALRWTVLPLARWRCAHLVVTNRRFLVREGLLTRDGLDVPIDRIDAVRVRAGLRGRMLGCGTLLLDVADRRLRFDDVAQVERVQARLHREIGRLSEIRHRNTSGARAVDSEAGDRAEPQRWGTGAHVRAVPERSAS